MKKISDTNSVSILQLKIRLLGINPMIWRRVLVPGSVSLRSLHGIIQVSMGWEGIHLYEFRIHAVRYGSIDLCVSSPDITLDQFMFCQNDRFCYVYDMGDWWEHEIRVEKCLAVDDHRSYPCCTGGAGVCPPEDCGGPAGYLMRRDEAGGYDAYQDAGSILEFMDDLLKAETFDDIDFDSRRQDVEGALERNRARIPYLRHDFSRRQVNRDLRDGQHEVLMQQQY